jgi:integrase
MRGREEIHDVAKRRGHHDSTVYCDETHQRWHAPVTVVGKRKSLYGKTAAEVREKKTKLERDRDRGLAIPEGQVTVKQYLAEWLEVMRPPRVRASTWLSHETRVRMHLIPGLGKHKLAKLSPHQVQQFYAEKMRSGISPTTVRRIHDVLHNALDDALRLDLVSRNVTELIDTPKEAEREEHYYSVEHVAQLLATLAGHRLESLVLVALTTGMRSGELLALQWRDVDLTCGAIQIRANRTKAEHGFTDGPTKTKQSAARIIHSPTALEALKRQRVRVKEERLAAGERWQDNDLVFPIDARHAHGPNQRQPCMAPHHGACWPAAYPIQ